MVFLGWLSGVLLSICGIPEAIYAIYQGRTSLTYLFIIMWFLGEFIGLLYIIYLYVNGDKKNILPILFNYVLNVLTAGILLIYKLIGD